jgi:anti-anti-sigma factor
MELVVKRCGAGNTPVIEICNDSLDISNVSVLREIMNIIVQLDSRKVIFDLNRISNIDSVGIGVLATIRNVIAGDGIDMAIACGNDVVMNVFELLNMHLVFRSYPTVEEAVNDLP